MRVLGALACALLGVGAGLILIAVVERFPAPEPGPDDDDLGTENGPMGPSDRPSSRRVVVVVATAGLFGAAAIRFGADWALPAYLVFFAALVVLSVIDFQYQILPNRIVYPAIFASVPLLALAALAEHDFSRLGRTLAGAALAWLAMLIVHLLSPGGMGFGDVRLSFLLGLFLGWLGYGYVLVGLFMGFLVGAVVGGGLVLLRIRKRTDHVPFGPFLAAGAAVTVLWGGPVVRSWLG